VSLDPILWALKDAPVGDVYERAILTVLAETADDDGCGAFPSVATVAERAMCSERQAARVIKDLVTRGLLGLGDPAAASYIDPRYRPIVYDLMIPYDWFSNVERINEYRLRKGRKPLIPADRPAIPAPPTKPKRAHYPKSQLSTGTPTASNDWQSPLNGASQEVQVSDGGLAVIPLMEQPGVTATTARGDCYDTPGVTGSHTNLPSLTTTTRTKNQKTPPINSR
jgi:hypothetical protein